MEKKSDSVPASLVSEELRRIEASNIFREASRHKELLRLVVERTLAGKVDQLKGPIIADKLFKSRDDVMRVEAGRLRRMLGQYYSEVSPDPDGTDIRKVRIDVPRGGYVATFAWILPCRSHDSHENPQTYVTTPPLPVNYLDRAGALDQLRATVVARNDTDRIAVVAIHGMGGIGKTVLAQALCRDEAVKQHFPEGIVWVPVGNESGVDTIGLLRELAKALNDRLDSYDTLQGSVNRYRTIMRSKAVLIVLDDIWRAGDVAPFLADAPASCLLITTRDDSLVTSLGAHSYPLTVLADDESRELLAKWCNTIQLPAEAEDLIRECGHLPLALAILGAMLRAKPPAYWKVVRGLLRRADLASIRTQFPNYPHPDLFRAIHASVDSLDPPYRDRYLSLAVLLEDMAAPLSILRTLWNVDGLDALETSERFVSLSLAQRTGDSTSIRLHDLQLDYVRNQSPLRKLLPLLHSAVRLSSVVIARDPGQFAGQITGRLQACLARPMITDFLGGIANAAPRPWLRPLSATLTPPGGGLDRTLEGHTDHIASVVMTAECRRAVSASYDKTLKVWDLDTGCVLRTLQGHADKVKGVAISADGRLAVSACWDGKLKVWDVETGRELRTMATGADLFFSIALSRDGRLAVSASYDRTLKVWDVETGRELRTLRGHTHSVNCVTISADRLLAISGSYDNTLKVWDIESGRELRTLEGHDASVLDVALSADGRLAVSASYDDTLKVWDVQSGRDIRTLRGHRKFASGVAISADGRLAISASGDETLKVWDVETGRELRTLKGHTDAVSCVAISEDGRLAISGSEDSTLRVWDLEAEHEIPMPQGHDDSIEDVDVSGDGRLAVSASGDKTLKVWDLETGCVLRTLRGHRDEVKGVAISADGRLAISGSSDNTLKVWDVESGRELRTLKGHSSGVWDVALSADGRLAVSASWDRTLKVWDVESGREVRTLIGHGSVVPCVVLSEDSRRVISASHDTTLKVWDVDTGCLLRTLEGHSGYIFGLALTSNGRLAVSASDDRTIRVWDVETGVEVRTFQDYGHSVRVHPNGRLVVYASYSQTVKLRRLDTGDLLAAFSSDAPTRCCAFAGEDRIVVGDAFGRLHHLMMEF